MDTDSPASYPKHVIVRGEDSQKEAKLGTHDDDDDPASLDHDNHEDSFSPPAKSGNLLTPDSNGQRPDQRYDAPIYPRHQPYHDVYRAPSYNPEMDYGRSNYGHGTGGGGDNYSRQPRRWACDYCTVATFLSYEEACAHEEECARRQHDGHFQDPHLAARASVATYGGRPPIHQGPQRGNGLGALYHASQEVVTPPTPHHHQQNLWGSRGPPLPVLPHEQNYYRQGYYDRRDDPTAYHDQFFGHPQGPGSYGLPGSQLFQKRMMLALPSDKDSLSDRQCYVRAEMVEIFAAGDKDVSARHSKGAQKLGLGQVGLRCVFCCHLRPRDRAERAVCYPSSISRIYQTVADMQRFHFEQCREIPDHVRQLYKKLKTTRPRGVGSPQSYWVSSAKSMSLVDSEVGIRFDTDLPKEQYRQSDMSVGTP